MRFYARLCAIGLLCFLASCAAGPTRQIEALKSPGPNARILLMPVDVELSELSAAGFPEPKADWTERARGHVQTALRGAMQTRGRQLVVFDDGKLPGPERETAHQIVKLHQAVGGAVLLHRLSGLMDLPTKKDKFDWSLGPETRMLNKTTGADYALFVFLRDSYVSPGRVAVMAILAVGGIAVPGGQQLGFASLVDLETGDIVWFNRLARGHGDLRDPTPARETIDVLLSGLPK
jgi:hypothetical protein